jgi:hypothetical protein
MGDHDAGRLEAEARQAAERRWRDMPDDLKQSFLDRLMRQHPGGRSERWYARRAIQELVSDELARAAFHD